MGGILGGSASHKRHILMLGLDGSGKTAFLCKHFLNYTSDEFTTATTIGYNFNKIHMKGYEVSVYDVGGKDSIRFLWPTFYKKILFHVIMIFIDASDDERLIEARKEIDKLANEEELRTAAFAFIYNVKQVKLKKEIEDDEKKRKLNNAKDIRDDKDGQDSNNRLTGVLEADDKTDIEKSVKDPEEAANTQTIPNEKEQDFSYEERLKYLDHALGLDQMHTFTVRRSFIFDIMEDSRSRDKVAELKAWLDEKF